MDSSGNTVVADSAKCGATEGDTAAAEVTAAGEAGELIWVAAEGEIIGEAIGDAAAGAAASGDISGLGYACGVAANAGTWESRHN